MIVVAGTFSIIPEKRDAAVAAVLAMVRDTKPEEGCITYDFYADLADTNRFHVFEEWESLAALEAHFKTPHMAVLQAAMPDLLTEPSSVFRFEVTSTTKL